MLTSEQRRAMQVASARYPDDTTIAQAVRLVADQDREVDDLRERLTAEGRLTDQGIADEVATLRKSHAEARAKLVADQQKRVDRLTAAATKSTPAPVEIEAGMRERLLDQFLALPREERTRAAVTIKDQPRLAAVLASVDPEDAKTLGIPPTVYARAQSIARGATHDPATGRDTFPNQSDLDNVSAARERMRVVESLTSL